MASKRHLVLGGDGLIGRSLCRRLSEQGGSVTSLDIKSGFDLRRDALQSHSGVDMLWFLAWDVGGAKYLEDPTAQHALLLSNVQISANVFEFLRVTGLPFLFTSSQLAGLGSSYGVTKALAELWSQKLGGMVARLWNVYGWEPPGLRSHVIPDLVVSALSEGVIRLRTTGQERRQFLYVEDCAEALLHQANLNEEYAEISYPPWITVRTVALEISRQTGADVMIGRGKGYDKPIDPTRPLKGWSPNVSLEEGIGRVIKAARDAGF